MSTFPMPAEQVSSQQPAPSNAREEHPPRAPLVLRIGVTGHRPDPKKRPMPDVAALRDISRMLLAYIQDTFAGVASAHRDLFACPAERPDGKPPGLRIVSALAEGPDQWVAAEAGQLGYELQAVLPFDHSEYEKDFTDPGVLAEHRRLRGLATAVFELDGCRARSGDSYLAAGRALLNQTDLLIALWDGKDAQGTGGTGQNVREALQRGIPVIWVNWAAPADWHLMQPGWRLLQQPIDIQGDRRLLGEQVRHLLLPPEHKHNGEEPEHGDPRETYFAEQRRPWTPLGGWWNFFRDFLRGRPNRLAVRVPEFIPETQRDWSKDWPRKHKLSDANIQWIEKNFLPHYAWANQLSVYCANHYRSSFAWIYLLGALAVLLALIGKAAHFSPKGELACISVEVLVICAIIGLTWYGRRRRWHERWIDYRTLAERLRLARVNCTLGGVWHQASVPSSAPPDFPMSSWTRITYQPARNFSRTRWWPDKNTTMARTSSVWLRSITACTVWASFCSWPHSRFAASTWRPCSGGITWVRRQGRGIVG